MRSIRFLALTLLFLASSLAPARAGDESAPPPKTEPAKAEPAKKDEPKKEAQKKDPKQVEAERERDAALAARALPAPRTLDQALTRLGTMHVDVDFKEVGLSEAAEFIGTVSRMNVMLSPALRQEGIEGLPKLTVKLRDISLRQTTELFAKLTQTKLVLRDGILQFTTAADARGKPVLRIYTLSDLTFKLRNFPGPDIQLHLASVEFEDEKESDVESGMDDPETIVAMIQKMCGEGTWTDDDVSISADARRLVVKQYPEVQKEIVRLLALLRAAK